jgi:SAM-dependent methyltransferase
MSIDMVKQAVLQRLMKLKESRIQFDLQTGAAFRELFDHPQYLALDESTRIELGLNWARHRYQTETDSPSLDLYFGKTELSKYFVGGATILDIGCYIGGKSIRWLEKFKAAEIQGIDIDPRFIEIANHFAKEKNANAHFKVNFAENLEFPDSFFDVIVSENTFEHVRDLHKVMSECNRVLKKGGFLVVIFPGFWGPSSHHLDLVSNTPFLHWFFSYPSLIKAYRALLDERGVESLWYRPDDKHPLPHEKGLTINGTGAMQFHRMVKRDGWKIVIDGFKQRTPHTNFIKNAILNGMKTCPVPIFRELLPVTYVLQKA